MERDRPRVGQSSQSFVDLDSDSENDFGSNSDRLVDLDEDLSEDSNDPGIWTMVELEMDEPDPYVELEDEPTTWTSERATKKLFEHNETDRDSKKGKKGYKSPKGLFGEMLQEVLDGGGLPSKPSKYEVSLKRLKDGPGFSNTEMATFEELSDTPEGQAWLSRAGLFTVDRARGYADGGAFYDWLQLRPANRVLIATVAYNEGLGTTPPSPAYSLGRHYVMRDETDERQEGAQQSSSEDIKDSFVQTMLQRDLTGDVQRAVSGGAIGGPRETTDSNQVFNDNAQAAEILRKVFLILQAGLQIYDEESGSHIDLRGTDVCRALGHGGRVNIRIPAKKDGETGHELTDWLGITTNGQDRGGAVFQRGFGTHHMAIGKNGPNGEKGTFREEGGTGASITNKFTKGVQLYGMNVSGGGMGNKDFNGDVILPDGAHGHMFIGFTPPHSDKDGALQIGMETTGPGAKSTVGYVHNFQSTEATANPESSFGGHKSDKIGDGKPSSKGSWEATNSRYVELESINGGEWLSYLNRLDTEWYQPLKESEGEQRALEALTGERIDPLVGPTNV